MYSTSEVTSSTTGNLIVESGYPQVNGINMGGEIITDKPPASAPLISDDTMSTIKISIPFFIGFVIVGMMFKDRTTGMVAAIVMYLLSMWSTHQSIKSVETKGGTAGLLGFSTVVFTSITIYVVLIIGMMMSARMSYEFRKNE